MYLWGLVCIANTNTFFLLSQKSRGKECLVSNIRIFTLEEVSFMWDGAKTSKSWAVPLVCPCRVGFMPGL